MEEIRSVILDLGNVLVFHDNARLFRNLAEAVRAPVEQVEALARLGNDDINRGRLDGDALRLRFVREFGVDLSLERFAELWSSHFTLHRDVLPYVERLRGRVRLALLSNTNALHVAYLRPKLPLLETFDALLFSNELGMVKPEAPFYREALRRTGAEPGQALFFDDVPEYVEGARVLGIHAHLFTTAEAFATRLGEYSLT